MTRYALSFFIFLVIVLFETSFLTSLPSPLSLTPLVFGLSVYLIQHQGLLDGLYWIGGYGLFLQLFHLSPTPFPLFLFPIAGVVSYLSARHLFSNRSLYGVMACGLVGFFSLFFLELIFLFFHFNASDSPVFWTEVFREDGLRLFMLLSVIILLFLIAKPIRSFLSYRTL